MKKTFTELFLILLLIVASVIFAVSCEEEGSSSQSSEVESESEELSSNEIKIIFDSNGGTEVEPQIIEKGAKIQKPIEPVKLGYTLDGWYADGEKWSFVGYNADSSMTLIAKWIPNKNNLVLKSNIDDKEQIEKIDTDKSIALPTPFEKDGYKLKGWTTTPNGKIEYEAGATYKMGTEESYTLYAVWEILEYKITYVINGGTDNSSNPSKYTVNDKIALTDPIVEDDFYIFAGWYSDRDFKNKVTTIEGFTGDMTLYAKSIANKKTFKSVSFYQLNDGSYSLTEIEIDERISIISFPKDYNPEVDGWYENEVSTIAIKSNSLKIISLPKSIRSTHAFEECPLLEYISVDEENTELKSIDGNLYKTSTEFELIRFVNEEAKIPDGLDVIGNYAFYGSSITSIDIPEGVTKIGYVGQWTPTAIYGAFSYCTSLKTITIPNSVIELGRGAFEGCTSLETIIIPENVTELGVDAFLGCTSLTKIEVSDDNECYKDVNGVLYTKSGEALINYPTANKATSFKIPQGVTYVSKNAFRNCTLETITIPSSVTGIGPNAFFGCTSLKNVNISDVLSWSKISFADDYSNPIYYARYKNVALDGTAYHSSAWSSNTFSKHIKDSIICEYGYGYWQPSTPSRDPSIDPDEIQYCGIELDGYHEIGEIILYIRNNSNYNIKYVVKALIEDKWVEIGVVHDDDDLYSITKYNTTVNAILFKPDNKIRTNNIRIECSDYGGWDVPIVDEIELWEVIPQSSNNARKLYVNGKEISGSINISSEITEISANLFYGCSKITSITIPNTVVSIGEDAFYGCTGLTSITMPSTVTKISGKIFEGCTSLKTIKCLATAMPSEWIPWWKNGCNASVTWGNS